MLYKKLNLTLLGVMSTTFVPNITYADLYTCKSCTNAPKGAYYTSSGTNATNCAWECSAGFIKKNNTCMCSGRVLADGNCRKYEELTTADFTKFQTETTAGKCKTGTLSAGAYMVRLRGGNGGSGGGNNTYDPKTQDGFSFNYKFYLKDNATYELCLGGDGSGKMYTYPEQESIGFEGTAGGTSSLKITMNKKDYFIFANGGWGTAGQCRDALNYDEPTIGHSPLYAVAPDSTTNNIMSTRVWGCLSGSVVTDDKGYGMRCDEGKLCFVYMEYMYQIGNREQNTIGKGTKGSYLAIHGNNGNDSAFESRYFYCTSNPEITDDDLIDEYIPASKMTTYPDASYSSDTCKDTLGYYDTHPRTPAGGSGYWSSECYDTLVGFEETAVHDALQPFNTNISGMETCTTACAELYKIVD